MFKHLITNYAIDINVFDNFRTILKSVVESYTYCNTPQTWMMQLDHGELGVGEGFEEQFVVNDKFIQNNQHYEILNYLYTHTKLSPKHQKLASLEFPQASEFNKVIYEERTRDIVDFISIYTKTKEKRFALLYNIALSKSRSVYKTVINLIEEFDMIEIPKI